MGIWVGTCGRNVNEAFDLGRILDCLSYGHWHTNVGLFKVFFVAEEHARTDARNGDIRVGQRVLDLLRIRHVLQLYVTLVSEVSSSFGLFESVIPDAGRLSVGESAGGPNASQHAADVVSKG